MSNNSNRENPSVLKDVWQKIRADKFTFACFLFLTICALCCFSAPIIAPYAYDEQNLQITCQAPTLQHIFGTDMLGRDILSRILYRHSIRNDFRYGWWTYRRIDDALR